MAGMQEFKRDLHSSSFDDAVALLVGAPSVWVMGARRSFPVAASRGAHLVAITDSQMSPLAALSAATRVVHESSTFGFRSLTNTMCLAQSLFIALAYRTELLYGPGDGDPVSDR